MNRTPTTLPLASAGASLATVGGKGRSLAVLAAAGFPVPEGFLVLTTAYRDFVATNDLQDSILAIVDDGMSQPAASLQQAAARIELLFEEATLPSEIVASLGRAYAALGAEEPAVAVRSSATAEDLPEMSFAGQQDTFLNVRGEAALLEAVRRCWASLWTARAIAYRKRMDIDQQTVSMGVIVQRMVPAEVSGVLFTANPASGDRTEFVVNASYGLGEAVVGGLVTPDTYLVDRTSFEIKQTVIGAKQATIVADGQQGTTTHTLPADKRGESSLSTATLQQLARLGKDVEALFEGVPQDIEWAVADGICWLLQSRPITNLPSPPLQNVVWNPPSKGVRLIRRQVVENMPGPLSPLFAELYLDVGLEQAIDRLIVDLGMPFKFEEFMERPMFVTVNGYAYCRASYHKSWRLLRVMPKVLFWYATSLRKLLKNVIPHWRDEGLPAYLAAIETWQAVDPVTATDEQLLSGVRALTVADATYWFDVAIVLGAAKVTDGLLNRFLKSKDGRDLTSGVFLRGFPSKVLQAQEELETIARRIQADERLVDLVAMTPAGDLLQAIKQHPDGLELAEDLHHYLEQYGHQIYTLDFVEPTQVEDPLPVLLSLKALVRDPGYDTRTRQAAMIHDRESRVNEILKSLGPLRRWLFRTLLGWANFYGPYREDALFFMGAAWPILRRMARELGARLVEIGSLTSPEDVYYLESAELLQAATARQEERACPDLGQLAGRRRELREARKRLHPPGMIPEKSRFKFGPLDFSAFETQKRNADDSQTLNGFAVSPGKVTGFASVILDAGDFEKMQPHTILVCPTTTPAWTPLFGQALGLATDIGGILAHGSIVAREYGIPAVMGTGNVTRRVVSGQRITVDGDAGTVTILE